MMKLHPAIHTFTLLGSLALAGCGANAVFPATGTNPVVSDATSLLGNIYGGHAPLVGAHIYVLSPNQTANPVVSGATSSTVSTSLMGSACNLTGAAASQCGSTLTLDSSGGPLNGYYYVTADSKGEYNLTGDYACTVNKAVYIVGVGGSPSYLGAGPNSFTVSSVVVSNVTGQGNSTGTATYTFNVSTPSPELFYVGETVTFAGLPATNNLNFFNSGSYTVSGTSLSTTGFQITFNADYGIGTGYTTPYIASGTYPVTTATAIGYPTSNPAAVNMAALGLCPASGTFAGTLSYIYMNEISTTAMAYAMAGFGADAYHIGVNAQGPLNASNPAYVLNSMKQALNNAALLYDIQGSVTASGNPDGDVHIARLKTAAGNGTVPQSKIDTIGNILAGCVDSQNTSATASPQCTLLFANATLDGTTTGTKPVDIAGAAFNIAHHPLGVGNASFTTALFNIPSGNVPFTPQLTTAPTDYSVMITFTAPSSAGGTDNLINQPQGISVDSSNNIGAEGIWIAAFGGQPVKLLENGTPDYATNAALASFGGSNERSVAVDTSNNVWITQEYSGALREVNTSGTILQTYAGTPAGTDLHGAAFDPSGNLFIAYGEDALQKVSPMMANIPASGGAAGSLFSTNSCLSLVRGVAVDTAGIVYAPGQNKLCVFDPNSAALLASVSGGWAYYDDIPSVGPNNILWNGNESTSLLGYRYSTGTTTTLTGGGLNKSSSTAVDGAASIFVGNKQNSSLSEFTYSSSTGTYTAASPTTGFVTSGIGSNGSFPAVDRAGDVWIASQGTAFGGEFAVYEFIGLGAPTITPIVYAVKNGLQGTRPY